jgi:hypothetical protein
MLLELGPFRMDVSYANGFYDALDAAVELVRGKGGAKKLKAFRQKVRERNGQRVLEDLDA